MRVVVALELVELELERVPRAIEVLFEPQQSLTQEVVRAHLVRVRVRVRIRVRARVRVGAL